MDQQRLIGGDNKLLWHLPADLAHFKAMTMGKPMVMGRKTWESLPGKLPGRPHIVVTRNKDYQAEGVQLAFSLEDALALADKYEEIMLVGGANLYTQALPMASRLYLTEVATKAKGDAYFPEFDLDDWQEVSRELHKADEKNRFDYCFVEYRRI